MKKGFPKIVAAIDVGSNFLRMMIAEISKEGKIVPLDDVFKPTRIGRDTFASGEISLQSVRELCDTLKGFRRLMSDYHIKEYRALATSGIREAYNRLYVLEQIRVRANLDVEVINNAEERFIMLKALRDGLSDVPQMRQEGILVVNIGMGALEASIYNQGALQFSEHIKAGSLRLREILADLERSTLDFPSIVEEFVESKIYLLEPVIKPMNIKNVIGLGGELNSILSLCQQEQLSKEEKYLPAQALHRLYTKIRSMTIEQLIAGYNLHRNEAEILLPSLIIFKRFLEFTAAKGIHVPMIALRHGILADMVDDWFDTQRKYDFAGDIISSVWYIGRKFKLDENHAAHVANLALSIFDQTRMFHKLGVRERMYLQVAAILHDIGKFINLTQHEKHASNIIRYQEIIGLSKRDLNIIANISRYHSEKVPTFNDSRFRILKDDDKTMVSKLAAILKLADAMDITHKQKIKMVQVSNSRGRLEFHFFNSEEVLLEAWNFESHCDFFEEVMGIRPLIKYNEAKRCPLLL
ncbi:MAG: HD domain-containing protein [Syntrophomonadaceae bacterium]|nr:HD domain-containing protein [Syntrophomonadaceae bacterium]